MGIFGLEVAMCGKTVSVSEMIMLDLLSLCCKTKIQYLKNHCERIWVCTLQHVAWLLQQKPRLRRQTELPRIWSC